MNYPYMRYITKRMERPDSKHEEIMKSHMRIPPGCLLHDHPRRDIVFNNWNGRGNKAFIFYWRMHSTEFWQINQTYKFYVGQ